jgi:hypothetical protein
VETVAQKITALNSVDPKARFAAVKEIARTKDVTMLGKLAELAGNDPNEQVRQVAAKAVAYIKGEAKAATSSAPPAEVSERDKERAKRFVDSALSYHIDGDKEHALKELSKALEINPGLEKDPFFESVLSEVADGKEALAILGDRSQLQEIASTERKRKREARAAEHQGEVGRSNWTSAGMDLTIYTLIILFATMFLTVITAQATQAFLDNTAAAIDEYNTLVASGELPPGYERVEVAPELEQASLFFSSINLGTGVLIGIFTGIGGLISILIYLFAIHLSARYIFGGQATFPHLIYKVVSFYNGRLPIMFVLIGVGILLTFLGSPFIGMIVWGALSLFNLYMAIKVINRVGETYDFGGMKGCLSVIVGGFAVAVVSTIAQFLFMGAIISMLGLPEMAF